VTTGSQTYRVVCGAPNVAPGSLPLWPPGAILAGGQKLKAAKLRGVLSEGMLLAEDELGLSRRSCGSDGDSPGPGAGPGFRRGHGAGGHGPG